MTQTPATMTAIEITTPGGPEVLSPTTRPVPQASAGELLIRIEAAGLNRADLLQRQGKYPPPPGISDIPGLEVAGKIVLVGAEVTGWRIGDAVCALLAGGGYAEFAAVPAVQCLPAPACLSLIEAAALPEALFTCWTSLVDSGGLKPGQTVLIHGGSSGIGTTGIQMATAMGCRVFITAGSAAKCEACRKLGADVAINYRTEDFVPMVKAATQGRGVDLVLDMVGGDYVRRNMEVLTNRGRHVSIAMLGGGEALVPVSTIMRKRLILTGSTVRDRSSNEKGAIAASLRNSVWPMIEAGKLRPVIQSTFPLNRAADAHRALEAGDHIGKLVLTAT